MLVCMNRSSILLSGFIRLIVRPEVWFNLLLCEIRLVSHCIRKKIALTLCTLVHLLWFLQPSNHLALTVTVGGRQAAVAAAAGGRRLPRQAAWLGLLGEIWLFCLSLHVRVYCTVLNCFWSYCSYLSGTDIVKEGIFWIGCNYNFVNYWFIYKL